MTAILSRAQCVNPAAFLWNLSNSNGSHETPSSCFFLCFVFRKNKMPVPLQTMMSSCCIQLVLMQIYVSDFDGLVQEIRNSSVLAMELHLSCTKPLTCPWIVYIEFWILGSFMLKVTIFYGTGLVHQVVIQHCQSWCCIDGLVQDCSNFIANALELL